MNTRAYPELKGSDRVRETCWKCNGSGVVDWGNVVFSNGKGDARWCFECNGLGYTSVLVSSIRARQARQAKAEAEAAKKAEAAAARYAEQEAQRKAQEAELEAKRAAERAAADPVPEGREVVTGEVVGLKWVPGYGYNSPDVLKMVVKDDRGFKVYGTMPRSIDAKRGERVTFTAQLEQSNDDDRFGFFKRPTKASVILEASN